MASERQARRCDYDLLLLWLRRSCSGCTSTPTVPATTAPTTTTSAAQAITAAEAYLRLPIALYDTANTQALKDLNASAAGTPKAGAAFTEFENAALRLEDKVSSYQWPTVAGADAHRLVLDLATLVADYGAAAAYQPAPNATHDLSVVYADSELLKTDLQW